VQLCGWLSHKRMNGRFLVLRDAYGSTQARVPEEKINQLDKLNLEAVLRIEGEVVDRGAGNRNGKMPTGEVEVLVDRMELLNNAKVELPVSMELKKSESAESTRMAHRYLDLRLGKMQKNLR
jgi:aspartyl-tRNA synthetase